jgi:hypothetical protein
MSPPGKRVPTLGWSFGRPGFSDLKSLGIAMREDLAAQTLRDTPEQWSLFVARVERHGLAEQSGHKPFAHEGTWDDFWETWITVLLDGEQENPERYIAYILEHRRSLGLADLPDRILKLIG